MSKTYYLKKFKIYFLKQMIYIKDINNFKENRKKDAFEKYFHLRK